MALSNLYDWVFHLKITPSEMLDRALNMSLVKIIRLVLVLFTLDKFWTSYNSRTLGSDDLTIFKCFRAIFSLKKEYYPISAFVQSLFSTKKSPKVATLPLTDETLFLSFWRHKQMMVFFRTRLGKVLIWQNFS